VRYALLVYEKPGAADGLSPEEREAILAEYVKVRDAAGVYGGAQLAPPDNATTVRVDRSATLLADRPAVESKLSFSGYYLVEADALEHVTVIAARIPAARMGGAIEVRPLIER
jgi:hypothetical protein